MSPPVKYIAEIRGVKEVTLIAAVDLEFWQDHLENTGLQPRNSGGHAEVLISAIRSRYMGIPFCELCIALLVSVREDAVARDDLYLLGAFHSSRFFAWIERNMFQTPYRHARVEVQIAETCSFRAALHGQIAISADAGGRMEKPKSSDECWEGRIYLPPAAQADNVSRNYFFAKISGSTEVTPFSQGRDVLQLSSVEATPFLRWLVESQIRGLEWHLRRNATHARSKTILDPF